MNTGNQVCTLKQAITLKELGIKQDGLFWFVQEKTPTNPNMILYGWPQESIPFILCLGQRSTVSTYNVFAEYCAFGESELAIMMDAFYETYRTFWGKWKCGDMLNDGFETPCEASADRLIFLLKTDERVTADACNERLTEFLK